MSNWSFIVAVNDDFVLSNCLLRSPSVSSAREVILERGHECAGQAYNAGIGKATGDVLIFAHQDVFLPNGWEKSLSYAVAQLEVEDPGWGVLGTFGIGSSGSVVGYVHSTGLRRTLGSPLPYPVPVKTLDEMCLVLRRSSGLRFDDHLPGFHLYGTDICLQAEQKGMRSYALSAFCIHNSNGIRRLPLAFWWASLYLRRKWFDVLPVTAPCVRITKSGLAMCRQFLGGVRRAALRKNPPGVRCPDPVSLYGELLLRGL